MAESPLVKKLLIKPGHRVAVLNPPAGYTNALGTLPPGARLVDKPEDPVDAVHLFVKDSQELEKLVPSAVRAVKADGLLWISYPKGGSKVKTDLNRDSLRESMEKRGLAGVSLVSIDDTWSAMRFRPLDRVGK